MRESGSLFSRAPGRGWADNGNDDGFYLTRRSHSCCTYVHFSLFLVTALAVCLLVVGCGNGAPNIAGDKNDGRSLKEFQNKLNIELEGQSRAKLTGTITKVEKDPHRVLVEVRVSEFHLVDGNSSGDSSSAVSRGDSLVIEVQKPDQEVHEGSRISAGVVVMKTTSGFRLLATNVMEV